ncbi:MAG: DUF4263 domain-containing protein [bacterium]|nr:DUF4263 domain-containing protein [bacterium]
MINWKEILPSFKETYGDFGGYLLSRLKSGSDITVDDCTAQLKSGGFASATRFIKNTDRIKTVVTALHIPDSAGKVHHYDIDLYRFKRNKTSDQNSWERQRDFSLREDEVAGLYTFLTEQNKLLGVSFDAKIATVIFSDKEIDTDDLVRKTAVIAQSPGGTKAIDKIVEEIVKGSGEEKLLTIGFTEDIIGKRRKELDDFEAILDNPTSREVSDIQAELKKIPWIFGPEYTSYDYKKAGEEIPDGRLKRVDGLSDVLEVKLPGEEVLRVDEMDRRFLAPKCAEALGQLISYLEFYYSAYTSELDDETEQEILEDRHQKYYRPKGILLIGRRSKDAIEGTKQKSDNHPKYMRRLLSYHHGIEILTYDDLLERARNALNNIEKSK